MAADVNNLVRAGRVAAQNGKGAHDMAALCFQQAHAAARRLDQQYVDHIQRAAQDNMALASEKALPRNWLPMLNDAYYMSSWWHALDVLAQQVAALHQKLPVQQQQQQQQEREPEQQLSGQPDSCRRHEVVSCTAGRVECSKSVLQACILGGLGVQALQLAHCLQHHMSTCKAAAKQPPVAACTAADVPQLEACAALHNTGSDHTPYTGKLAQDEQGRQIASFNDAISTADGATSAEQQRSAPLVSITSHHTDQLSKTLAEQLLAANPVASVHMEVTAGSTGNGNKDAPVHMAVVVDACSARLSLQQLASQLHQVKDRLGPNALLCPGIVVIIGALVESDSLVALNEVDTAAMLEDTGLDYAPCNELLWWRHRPVQVARHTHTLLSRPAELLRLTSSQLLSNPAELLHQSWDAMLAADHAGRLDCVVCWMEYELAPGVVLSFAPPAQHQWQQHEQGDHWQQQDLSVLSPHMWQRVHYLHMRPQVAAGQRVTLTMALSGDDLHIELDESQIHDLTAAASLAEPPIPRQLAGSASLGAEDASGMFAADLPPGEALCPPAQGMAGAGGMGSGSASECEGFGGRGRQSDSYDLSNSSWLARQQAERLAAGFKQQLSAYPGEAQGGLADGKDGSSADGSTRCSDSSSTPCPVSLPRDTQLGADQCGAVSSVPVIPSEITGGPEPSHSTEAAVDAKDDDETQKRSASQPSSPCTPGWSPPHSPVPAPSHSTGSESSHLAGCWVQPYHINMLNDRNRNIRYWKGIQGAVRRVLQSRPAVHNPPVVLDIGAGTGLLSMLASKAGAPLVVGCERELPLVMAACTLAAANGCSGAVSMCHALSSELQTGEACELPRAASLVVHEMFGTDPLSERVLPTMLHVQRHLAREDALFLPSELRVIATLAHSQQLHGSHRTTPDMQATRGLDLSALAPWAPWKVECDVLEVPDMQLLSVPTAVLHFLFASRPLPLTGSASVKVQLCKPTPVAVFAQSGRCWQQPASANSINGSISNINMNCSTSDADNDMSSSNSSNGHIVAHTGAAPYSPKQMRAQPASCNLQSSNEPAVSASAVTLLDGCSATPAVHSMPASNTGHNSVVPGIDASLEANCEGISQCMPTTNCIVYWFEANCEEGGWLSTGPGYAHGHWVQNVQLLPVPAMLGAQTWQSGEAELHAEFTLDRIKMDFRG